MNEKTENCGICGDEIICDFYCTLTGFAVVAHRRCLMRTKAELAFKKLFNARTYLVAQPNSFDAINLIHIFMDKTYKEWQELK